MFSISFGPRHGYLNTDRMTSICEYATYQFLNVISKKTFLKVLNQFDFFASLISIKFCEKPNLPSIESNRLARLCNFCNLFFMKSSDKLFN